MKNIFRKILSLSLVLSLLWTAGPPAAASEALGEELTAQDILLGCQTRLSTNVFWSTSSSDFRRENLVTYYPGQTVTPIVTCGSVLTEKSTVSAAARALEAQGRRVVAGINGDFYVVSSGVPVGLVITGGQLRSSDGGFHAIGFREDGSALLGQPGISLAAGFAFTRAVPDEGGTEEAVISLRPVALNKGRNNDGVYLYTWDFNARHTTGTTQPGVDVVCNILEGDISVGGTLTAAVDQVLEANTATAMGPDQLVFSVNLEADADTVELLRSIPAGASLTLTVSAAEGWEDVRYAVGGLYSLVENGVTASGLDAAAAPRTAVGQRPDGSVIFYTIDGRRSGHSIGASMSMVAMRMIELGCDTALCMDGGGSTTISVTEPDMTAAQTINTPSDGAERAVTNHIFLVADNTPSGELDHFYVTADHPYVLAGSAVQISAAAVDTNYIPMGGVSYELSADSGELFGNVLTTPAGGGVVTVTAEARGRTGSAAVHAVTTPDSVSILRNGSAAYSLSAAPDSVTQLTAAAMYNHTALHADQSAFTWTVEGEIGTVDRQGLFTAGNPGSGTITVSAGGRSASIPVTVSGLAFQTVEDFEGETTIFRGTGTNLDYSLTSAADHVRMGRSAGALAYTFSQKTGYAAEWRVANPSASIAAPYGGLSVWLYGDGSGSDVSLLLRDSGGTESARLIASVDYTGWRQAYVALPDGGATLLGLRITPRGYEEGSVYEPGGMIYIDHIAASCDGTLDETPPVIQLTPDFASLTAVVSDDKDGMLPRSSVSVTWDGAPQDFAYDVHTGVLTTAMVSPDGGPHRITVTVKDASGNIGRASRDVPASIDWQPHFIDTQGYWAADCVDYLYAAGITTGYGDGTFRPGQSITRAQFAAMLYRYLKLEDPEDGELPFADSGSIPGYAVAAIRALYARGVINGSRGQDGKLYFNPNSSLSRAQAAAMIGRTQEKGYALGEPAFSDAGDIPAYAAFYIRTMAAQGVLSGYADGTFRPNQSITRGQMAKILYTLM